MTPSRIAGGFRLPQTTAKSENDHETKIMDISERYALAVFDVARALARDF